MILPHLPGSEPWAALILSTQDKTSQACAVISVTTAFPQPTPCQALLSNRPSLPWGNSGHPERGAPFLGCRVWATLTLKAPRGHLLDVQAPYGSRHHAFKPSQSYAHRSHLRQPPCKVSHPQEAIWLAATLPSPADVSVLMTENIFQDFLFLTCTPRLPSTLIFLGGALLSRLLC